MKLTLATVRRQTKRALRDNRLSATIVSIAWLGQRCACLVGPLHFRVARVVLESSDGRRLSKTATVYDDGSFRIA